MAENGELEVTGPGGIGARAKGYRLMDLVCLVSAFGVGYISMMVYNHDANAAKESTAIVQALKADRQETIAAIKENTRAMREQVGAQRVANCLASLTTQQRSQPQMLEFCKSLDSR